MSSVIGADLALNHGALVDEQGQIIYKYWDGDGLDSTIEMLWSKANEIASYVPLNSIVAVDWDTTSWAWGRNPKVGFLMGLQIVSFAACCILSRKSDIHYVPPRIIRKCLGLSARASKAEVHKVVSFPKSIAPYKKKDTEYMTAERLKELRGDLKDAYVLAHTYDCSQGM